ncbi:Uncharacterised protein [Vibrio cholerae]|nr:Uncharacterised protein [Vibrio cholerae]
MRRAVTAKASTISRLTSSHIRIRPRRVTVEITRCPIYIITTSNCSWL